MMLAIDALDKDLKKADLPESDFIKLNAKFVELGPQMAPFHRERLGKLVKAKSADYMSQHELKISMPSRDNQNTLMESKQRTVMFKLPPMHSDNAKQILATGIFVGGQIAAQLNGDYSRDAIQILGIKNQTFSDLKFLTLTAKQCFNVRFSQITCSTSITLHECSDILLENIWTAQLRLNKCSNVTILGDKTSIASHVAVDGCSSINNECEAQGVALFFFDQK